MDRLSSDQLVPTLPTASTDAVNTTTMNAVTAGDAPLSPPASPTFPLANATVSRYTAPTNPPRFPRHPCPTSHYTLSLLSSEHEAQRLFGPAFTLRSPTTGELLGPFALLSYTDAWIPKYCRYIHSVVSTPVFTLRERELVILAVAGVSQAEYVVGVHRRVAREVGLREGVVEGALAGVEMGDEWMGMLGLSAREKNVWRIAREMAQGWGRVSEKTWGAVVVKDELKGRGVEGWLDMEGDGEDVKTAVEDGEKKMGDGSVGEKPDRLTREEVATLAQVLASTMFVSVLANCADVKAPKDAGDIIQQP
ncbi:hypothetical protein C7974DRAFT_414144 [Boeremia exigua]|uniref:uncharacterized protein n=1 Tax=Boeremia exigua TaxID=749465 RepID=UPI001E8D4C3B|nr:uncharacterized protein C7974DRAFT_414144 [Boeremia exigua]KAH6625644.1 hypothetical protein C7974DRAFT_414144 [Boeremia exigua]